MSVETLSGRDIESTLLQTPGPLILDFYQESCPPCRALEPRLERVAERFRQLPIYRIDIDHDLPVAEQFGVMSLPTVIIVCKGREIERLDGLITEVDLTAAFERALRC